MPEDGQPAEPPTATGGVSRREFVGRAAAGAGAFAFGALVAPAAAFGVGSPGTSSFSAAFGKVIGFTDTLIRLPVGEIRSGPQTRVYLDRIARESPDRGIPERADGVRFGDLVYATGPQAADGSIVAETIWSGVLVFPAAVGNASTGALTVSPIAGGEGIRAVPSDGTTYRVDWGAPTPTPPNLSRGQQVVVVGILEPGYQSLQLAGLVAM